MDLHPEDFVDSTGAEQTFKPLDDCNASEWMTISSAARVIPSSPTGLMKL
jgi:hypothetical protein